MLKTVKHIVTSAVVLVSITALFSCKDRLSKVQKIGLSEHEPIGVAENFNLKYTDSGKLKADLTAIKMRDFSNRNFPYLEFTDGAHLELFDDENKKSTIDADYAMVYNQTDIIDMRGNVVIATASGDTLFAEQLYYDQKKTWAFTNKAVTFKQGVNVIHGTGFDANSDFTYARVLKVTGKMALNDKDL